MILLPTRLKATHLWVHTERSIRDIHGSPQNKVVCPHLESELSPKVLCGYPRGKVTIVNLETNQPEIGRDRN